MVNKTEIQESGAAVSAQDVHSRRIVTLAMERTKLSKVEVSFDRARAKADAARVKAQAAVEAARDAERKASELSNKAAGIRGMIDQAEGAGATGYIVDNHGGFIAWVKPGAQ